MFFSDLSQWLALLFPLQSFFPFSRQVLFIFHIKFYFLLKSSCLPTLATSYNLFPIKNFFKTMSIPLLGPFFHSALYYNHLHIEFFPLSPSNHIHLEGKDCIIVSPAMLITELGMLKALSQHFASWIKDCIVDKYPLIYFIFIKFILLHFTNITDYVNLMFIFFFLFLSLATNNIFNRLCIYWKP